MELSKLLKRIGNDNSGATAIEYGLIAALIVIAMLGALNSVASETISMWDAVTSEVSSVNGS
ncbi:MAG TPA: Flp family type IVb pilin [Erythrobacter sp.]|nr:Flp family type IVb pilin [Erythrobacter sp.]